MLRILSIVLLLFSSTLHAGNISKPPGFTYEMIAGIYQPDDENWASYYGSQKMPEAAYSLAYRVFSVIDFGMSIGYGKDKGKGRLPISGLKDGDVTYEIMPVDFYLLLRGRFAAGQWVVPYAGGGYTRFFYRQSIDNQGYSKGSVNGLHVRAGLQFLLDPLDKQAAREIYKNYGVINSYFIVEAKKTKAEAGSPALDIGGTSFRTGIMVEY